MNLKEVMKHNGLGNGQALLLVGSVSTWHALVESVRMAPCAAVSVCVRSIRESAGVRIQHTLS